MFPNDLEFFFGDSPIALATKNIVWGYDGIGVQLPPESSETVAWMVSEWRDRQINEILSAWRKLRPLVYY